ncbi:MAG: hypothetical protein Alis3KO_04040 [Aliiglaciecola sp.]
MSKSQPLASSVVSLFVTLTLLATILWTWQAQLPSDEEDFSIGGAPYSTKNAWSHLNNITKAPHYTGSADHTKVRDYIVDALQELGLQVEVQSTLSLSSKYPVASHVENIIAKKPATVANTNPNGLALMSHYDSSTYSSYGASDAGSGVVVIIETMRTLIESGLEHSNDIYVVITDAEEQGLLGAEAFVAEHRYAKNIDLVLNFEARGSGGASYTLLETNGGNQTLIDAFAQAGIKHPAANSLMYSIYKMLPNDTDLTIFREQGDINGFNFAFIDDHFDYHTAQDTAARLDPSSFNHQIDYITALVPHFASADLTTLDSNTDYVYVNFANLGIIDYPFSWVLPMALLALIAFLGMMGWRAKNNQLSLKHLFLGIIPVIVCITLAVIVGWAGWRFLVWWFPQFADIRQGFTYSGHYIVAFGILLAMSSSAWFYSWITTKYAQMRAAEWYSGIVLFWLLINLLIAVYLTGAGFFIVIAISSLLILWLITNQDLSANYKAILICLLSIPGLVLITPQIPVFVIGLGLSSLSIATVLSVLVLMTFLPLMFLLKGVRSIQLFMTAGALISLIGVGLHAQYNVDQKKPSGVNYLFDAEQSRAFLFSYDKHLDSFNQQFFTQNDTDISGLRDVYPITPWRHPTFAKDTLPLNLQSASFFSKSKLNEDGSMTLSLEITPKRSLNFVQLSSSEAITVDLMSLQGKEFKRTNRQQRPGFVLRYVVTKMQPISISMTYRSDKQPEFRLIETAFDLTRQLPEFKPRPEHIMPTPFRYTDATIISQRID